MKVAQVNSSVAPTAGQPLADESVGRADDFARVLQTAVYGKGREAVAKTTERVMSAAAPRTETRPVERAVRAEPAPTRPETTPAQRRETDARDTAAAQKPAESKAPVKTDAAPPTKDAATDRPAAGQADKTDATAPQETATATPADQTADAAVVTPVVAPIAVPAAPAAAAILSEDAAAAALAAAAEAQAKAAAPAQAVAPVAETAAVEAETVIPVAPQVAAPVAATDPQIKTTTDTSAAALLSQQQQTLSAEDFAAFQQALTAQNQGQAQVQDQAGKPAVTAEAKQKAEPKADKILTVDIQTVSATPKTLVDQTALLAVQDDDQAAADMAQLQQQAQAALQQTQQATPELKFNAALLQAADDMALQAGSSTGNTNGHSSHQTAAIGSTTATQVAQSAHQTAATQTAARHLNAYVPVGEQVGVQIKKGVAEGLDKISIKLDPGNLGKVEIKLEIGHDGRLQAVIAADKPETLQLLQQDVKNLEQSLRDAGLKTDQQSLNFTLRDQSQAGEGRDGNGAGNGRQRNRGGDEYADTGMAADPAQLAAANAQRAAAARGGLDIRI